MTVKVILNSPQNAAMFTHTCMMYDCDIDYKIGRFILDAKSFLGVMSAQLNSVAEVTIRTEDKDVIDRFIKDIQLWVV